MKNLLFFLLLIFYGCGQDKGDDDYPQGEGNNTIIELSDTCTVVLSDTLITEMTLTSKEAWTITGNPDWCSVSPMQGAAGTYTLTIELTENLTSYKRDAQLIISSKGQKRFYRVSQQSGIIEIADINFRNYCMALFDINEDGLLSCQEARKVITMTIPSTVSSLQGIEYFTELLQLTIDGANISSFDLSKNTKLTSLMCTNLKLGKLTLNYSDLYHLYCNNCGLTELDVTGCPKLQHLYCENNSLTELDLSRNKGLIYLDCMYNRISSLDLTQNIYIQYIYSIDNPLEKLDIKGLSELSFLSCRNSKLYELDISSCQRLLHLDMYNSSLLRTVWVWKGFTAPTSFFVPKTAVYKEKQ